MPSLPLSDDAVLSVGPKDKKEKKKKIKNQALTEENRKRNSKVSDSEEDGSSKVKKKKESKKRKASDFEAMVYGDEEKSETSSELVEPENLKAEKKKKKKKAKFEEAEVEQEEEVSKKEDPNAISNFRISEPLRAKLKEKGIESLFPIQAMTFDTILDGSDLVGRARTGQVCSWFCILRHGCIL